MRAARAGATMRQCARVAAVSLGVFRAWLDRGDLDARNGSATEHALLAKEWRSALTNRYGLVCEELFRMGTREHLAQRTVHKVINQAGQEVTISVTEVWRGPDRQALESWVRHVYAPEAEKRGLRGPARGTELEAFKKQQAAHDLTWAALLMQHAEEEASIRARAIRDPQVVDVTPAKDHSEGA